MIIDCLLMTQIALIINVMLTSKILPNLLPYFQASASNINANKLFHVFSDTKILTNYKIKSQKAIILLQSVYMNNNQLNRHQDGLIKVIKDIRQARFKRKIHRNHLLSQENQSSNQQLLSYSLKRQSLENYYDDNPHQNKKKSQGNSFSRYHNIKFKISKSKQDHQLKEQSENLILLPICKKPTQQLEEMKIKIKSITTQNEKYLNNNANKISTKIKDKYRRHKTKSIITESEESLSMELTKYNYYEQRNKEDLLKDENNKMIQVQQQQSYRQIYQNQKLKKYNEQLQEQLIRQNIKNDSSFDLKISEKYRFNNHKSDQTKSLSINTFKVNKRSQNLVFQRQKDTLLNVNDHFNGVKKNTNQNAQIIVVSRLWPLIDKSTKIQHDHLQKDNQAIKYKNAESYIKSHLNKHYYLTIKPLQIKTKRNPTKIYKTQPYESLQAQKIIQHGQKIQKCSQLLTKNRQNPLNSRYKIKILNDSVKNNNKNNKKQNKNRYSWQKYNFQKELQIE